MNKWIYTMALLMTIALVAAGCGGGDKDSSSTPAQAQEQASDDSGSGATITVDASNFKFDKQEIKVKKGDKVTLKLVNSQGNHSLKLDGYGKEVKGNQTVTFTADKTGEFNYFCNIMCGGGHAEMKGKLIVE